MIGSASGSNNNNTHFTNIQVHDNEITDWNNWSIPSSMYHTNGLQMFNYGCSNCSIGDPGSYIYNNYVHGDLTGGHSQSSPTALLSAQDNSTGFNFFNNRIDSTCAPGGAYYCGAGIWFVGPGGGNMTVYNNTITSPVSGGSIGCVTVNTTDTASNVNIIENNIFVGCSQGIAVEPSDWI